MKENVAHCLMDIRFISGIVIVFDADGIASLVEKFFLSLDEDSPGIGNS